MSGHPRASTPTSTGFSYDYGDAFVGAMRAYKAANMPMDVVATIQSDDNPFLCAWKEEGNTNFKVVACSRRCSRRAGPG